MKEAGNIRGSGHAFANERIPNVSGIRDNNWLHLHRTSIRGRNLVAWWNLMNPQDKEQRLTKIQTTTRPDHNGPEAWMKIGKAVQKREEQECENVRNLRGIYFIDPSDEDHKDIIENARRKIGNALWILQCHVKERFPKLGNRETRTSLRMRDENWKRLWLLQCHVKERFPKLAIGKPLLQKQSKPEHLF